MPTDFPLGTVLTVTTGRSLCEMDDLRGILNYMTGENLFMHQIPRAINACSPVLLAQHPALRTIAVPEKEKLDSREKAQRWVDTLAVRLGDELPVKPLESWDSRNPLEELIEMRGNEPIIAVAVPGETS